MLNIGSMCTGAKVHAVKSDLAKLQLTSPVCTRVGEKVALSRRVEKHWRLIGANGQILLYLSSFEPTLLRGHVTDEAQLCDTFVSAGWGQITAGQQLE